MPSVIMESNIYEAQRQLRIQQNQQRLEALGVLQQKTLMEGALKVVRNPMKRLARKDKVRTPPSRASLRCSGGPAEFAGLSHEDDAAIERNAASQQLQRISSAAAAPAGLTEAQAGSRCNSKSRGSIYDSVAGITCHFCRQKKLCGEANCPRCANRDPDATCIGKSECSRCASATGRFCRACLAVRYGLQLEDVRTLMAAGEWLCPHCYEDDHPNEGWICNSSICMTRRGMRPTGIAIFEAQALGFKSVAQLVAHKLVGKEAMPVGKGASKKCRC